MRITGGVHRSRRLLAPKGDGTRPTADRVREALFSILHATLPLDGVRVLDLYAGTGALALEALSRGAAAAVLVDRGREAAAAIRANVASLGAEERAALMVMDVGKALSTLADRGETFGLIFADPPYADVPSGALTRSLAHAATVLGVEGVLVLEHAAAALPPALPSLTHTGSRRYGDTALAFYQK